MHRLILIVTAFLFCCDPLAATQPTTRPVPTTASATQSVLKPIELHYGIYLAGLDLRVTVSAEGVLRSVQTDNKSYGDEPKNERVEVREGRLTDEQIATLARLFADWDSFSSKPYSGVPDGGNVSIRYGEKTVSGGSEVPKQVTDIRLRLTKLGQSMPVKTP